MYEFVDETTKLCGQHRVGTSTLFSISLECSSSSSTLITDEITDVIVRDLDKDNLILLSTDLMYKTNHEKKRRTSFSQIKIELKYLVIIRDN